MTHPWNGHPLMNADRDGWHLLRFEDQKHPEPMWWDAKAKEWRLRVIPNPYYPCILAAATHGLGYTYVAGMVTVEEWEGRKA